MPRSVKGEEEPIRFCIATIIKGNEVLFGAGVLMTILFKD